MHRENHSIALRWLQAFNQKNLDGLLSLYWDDARHFSPRLKDARPETEGWIQGKPALHDWWGEAFATKPTLEYRAATIETDPNHIRMSYNRLVKGEPKTRVKEEMDIVEKRIKESRVVV